jgi:hypothetical protein
MFDRSTKIAVIRLLELGPIARRETFFRSVTFDVDPARRSLIGYFPSLRFAAEVTWAEWKKAHGVLVPPLLDLDDDEKRPPNPKAERGAASY